MKIKRKYKNKVWLDKKSRKGNEKRKKAPKKIFHKFNPRYTMFAPENFSIINNMEFTIEAFNNFISTLNQKKYNKSYYIDLRQTVKLTIDAVMYLSAVVNNIKLLKKYNPTIYGNLPKDEVARKFFRESGFLSYVHSKDNIAQYKCNDKMQIVSGNEANNKIAKDICDFTTRILGVQQTKIRFLYNTIKELMQNTVQHAYEDENLELFDKIWYIYAEDSYSEIKYTFLDTGVGIPNTVRKNFFEKLINMKDYDYIISALEGKNRTQTREKHRGKGLQEIYGYVKEDKLNNFHVISGAGVCSILNKNKVLSENENKLTGTIYYWEIPKIITREEKYSDTN